jgi:hypothetical protein
MSGGICLSRSLRESRWCENRGFSAVTFLQQSAIVLPRSDPFPTRERGPLNPNVGVTHVGTEIQRQFYAQTGGRKYQALANSHRCDAASIRSQRHANTNLACALPHREVHQAVDAYPCQQQRQNREDRKKRSLETAQCELLLQLPIHARMPAERTGLTGASEGDGVTCIDSILSGLVCGKRSYSGRAAMLSTDRRPNAR